MPTYLDLLPAEITAAMTRQEFLARGKMEGGINGRHSSPKKGFSVEFAEHRQYARGDDLRNLDWRVYAKADRYYIKQYIEETNLRGTIVLDASGSMAYRGDHATSVNGTPVSKFEYARYLAAALAFLLIRQQDGAGLVTFDSGIRKYLRATAKPSQVHQILQVLHETEPGRDTEAAKVLHAVAERIPPRGTVFIISDLFDDGNALAEALHHFHYRKHELVVFHVMAEEEFTFPFTKFSDFRDLELAAHRLRIDPAALRASYLENVREFIAKIEAACGQLNADYVPVNTSRPVAEVLSGYLAGR